MEKLSYNYRATGTIAYLFLRKIAITLARKEEIETRTASRSIVGEIVDSLYYYICCAIGRVGWVLAIL